MREILFTGKDKQSGYWIDGSLVTDCAGLYIVHQTETSEPWHITEIIPKTVSQYTGLTDKNKTKIFENDIVKVNSNRIGYIKFLQQEMGYCVVYSNFDTRLGHRNTGGCYDNNNFIEVIGNIFDNPELLK